MNLILEKQVLAKNVIEMFIEDELISKKALPGQFIILRVNEDGERIPLTIAGVKDNSVRIIFQVVGATTYELSLKEKGDYIADFVGPLGNPSELANLSNVLVIGGGVGCAIALPIAEYLASKDAKVTSIIGFKNKEAVILEDDFNKASDDLYITTDDGSYQIKGNVTLPLENLLKENNYDMIFAIGPLIMEKFVTLTAKKYNQKVTVSLNPIMIDGTGMCGGCRVGLIKDEKKIYKFACVDGPDFNGYEVDFDEAINRNKIYLEKERHEYEKACNLFRGVK